MFIDRLKQNLRIRNGKQAKLNLCYSNNNNKQYENQYNKQNFQIIHNYKDNSITNIENNNYNLVSAQTGYGIEELKLKLAEY